MKFSMELTFENFSSRDWGWSRCATLQQMCRDVQHTATNESLFGDTLQHVCRTYCNTCVTLLATHCNRYVAMLQHTMSLFCNTCVACAQHTATHAPQFATHCNTRVVSVLHTASNMSPCCNTQYRYLATHVSLFAIRCATHCNK